jgi:hypothetical protein
MVLELIENYYYAGTHNGEYSNATSWQGQTFTVGNTGENKNYILKQIKILARRYGTTSSVDFRIYETSSGVPTGSPISQDTIDVSGWSSATREWRTIEMPEVELQASTMYAIVWTTPRIYCEYVSGYAGTYPDYTGGTRVISSNGGASWIILETEYCFEVWGEGIGIGTNCKINIDDEWKEVNAIKINIDDEWKEVASAKVNIGDEWKTIF